MVAKVLPDVFLEEQHVSTLHPVDVLYREHRIIERVLDAVEHQVLELGSGPFPKAFFEQALDFFANFADRCHHGKEEQRLFPALKERGIPERGGPIGVMLHEHCQGRAHLEAVRANLAAAAEGDAKALGVVRREAMSYVILLRQHIQKEDHILFAMARVVRTQGDVERLQREFACVEEHHIGPGVHEHYERLADELAGPAEALSPGGRLR